MRDLIWTIIVIWLVYRLVDIFKKKPQSTHAHQANQSHQTNANHSDDKIKSAMHKQADKEGEYVDFEEIK
jgi:hypothetical protein